MKKKLAILLLAALTMTACSKEPKEVYPCTMIVTELETETDKVILRDAVGYEWAFYGIEDWMVGDLCACIMDTKGTQIITDDVIVQMRYTGRMEHFE